MANTVRDPQTPQEWQEAVDLAEFYRSLYDCQLYCLITISAEINTKRCDSILNRGAKLGYKPKDTILQLKEMVHGVPPEANG